MKADYCRSFVRGHFDCLLWLPMIYTFTRRYNRHSYRKVARVLRIGWLWWGVELKSVRVERVREK